METNETKDALLAQLLNDDDLQDDVGGSGEAYGVGKWPDAVLEEVIEKERNEYGFSIGLKFDLLGMGGGKPFTLYLNLPSADDDNEKRQSLQSDNLASIMHAGQLLPKGKKFSAIDSQARYEKLVAIFKTGIGSTFPIENKARKDKPQYTNTWGLRAKGA